MPKNEWNKYIVTATKMICIDYEVTVEAANESHAKSCAEVGEYLGEKINIEKNINFTKLRKSSKLFTPFVHK